jgi:hypothetical protein
MTDREAAQPTVLSRVIVAIVIAILATAFFYIHQRHWGNRPGDFDQVWFSARAMLHDANPYRLVGPGKVFEWHWPLFYPGTAMVAALPLTPLSQFVAALSFVFIGSGLLGFAVTAQGWHRLPIFLSAPFLVAVAAAQWSPLLTAGFLFPPVAFLFAAKPNAGLAMMLSTSSKSTLRIAVIGGVVLTSVSLMLFPLWPAEWLHSARQAGHMVIPVLRPGGVIVLLALLRWRRPEARLLVVLACVQQTPTWYEALPIFLVALTYRENLVLALLSWIGFFTEQLLMTAANEIDYNRKVSIIMIALIYLPATWMVLHRPNEGELPAWAQLLTRYRRTSTTGAVP